jgi:hypothetical protein
MALELPEIVCVRNHRPHNYEHPYTTDLGRTKDENIPDGKHWVCNYARTSLSNGFFLISCEDVEALSASSFGTAHLFGTGHPRASPAPVGGDIRPVGAFGAYARGRIHHPFIAA